MAYYVDLFSPETYEAFGRSDRTVSGFSPRQRMVDRVRTGDKFVCYMTGLSRWVGILEVLDGPFENSLPIFYPQDDPFTVRFQVNATVWLPLEKTIPIHDDEVWSHLSFTRDLPRGSHAWTGKVRASLAPLSDSDGAFLETSLRIQTEDGRNFPVDPADYRKLLSQRVRRADRDVHVTVPEDDVQTTQLEEVPQQDIRESIQIQALLAQVGSKMGLNIWIPPGDKQRVLAEWRSDHSLLLDRLPLNYDDTTLRTIEQIDVLWLIGRSIRRAFEIEHTTSVYSGLLRMADLLALQPNMDINLHIVAPIDRKAKVFQEIRRPVFALLERGPLSEHCSFLSYDSIREVAGLSHLPYLRDGVLDDYEEQVDT